MTFESYLILAAFIIGVLLRSLNMRLAAEDLEEQQLMVVFAFWMAILGLVLLPFLWPLLKISTTQEWVWTQKNILFAAFFKGVWFYIIFQTSMERPRTSLELAYLLSRKF